MLTDKTPKGRGLVERLLQITSLRDCQGEKNQDHQRQGFGAQETVVEVVAVGQYPCVRVTPIRKQQLQKYYGKMQCSATRVINVCVC